VTGAGIDSLEDAISERVLGGAYAITN
jgi:hypothetical protein